MNYDSVIQEKRLCAKRERERKELNILVGEHKKLFPLSISLSLSHGWETRAEFPRTRGKGDPSANRFCTSATGSICDVSAATPEIAPTGAYSLFRLPTGPF